MLVLLDCIHLYYRYGPHFHETVVREFSALDPSLSTQCESWTSKISVGDCLFGWNWSVTGNCHCFIPFLAPTGCFLLQYSVFYRYFAESQSTIVLQVASTFHDLIKSATLRLQSVLWQPAIHNPRLCSHFSSCLDQHKQETVQNGPNWTQKDYHPN